MDGMNGKMDGSMNKQAVCSGPRTDPHVKEGSMPIPGNIEEISMPESACDLAALEQHMLSSIRGLVAEISVATMPMHQRSRANFEPPETIIQDSGVYVIDVHCPVIHSLAVLAGELRNLLHQLSLDEDVRAMHEQVSSDFGGSR